MILQIRRRIEGFFYATNLRCGKTNDQRESVSEGVTMIQIWKMLFPKLYLGFADDQNPGAGDPQGQPDPDSGNIQDPDNDPDPNPPTEFVEVKGVKIPASEFEQLAREKYKDRFEAYDNREAWQKENTRKSQEIAEFKRKAELADRLMADPRFNQQNPPRNEYEAMKEEYISEHSEFYPDADPKQLRSFLSKQFEWNAKLAGFKANESLDPIRRQQAEDFEAKFLASHPDIKRGTQEYEAIADLMRERGFDAEDAYEKVMGWGNPEKRKALIQKENEAAIKARDEEARRKLKNSKAPSSNSGTKPRTTFDESYEKAWAMHGD